MAMQLIATGIVHKESPTAVNYEGQDYERFRVIHPGANGEPIVLNAHVTPGSHQHKALEAIQKHSAEKAAAGEKVHVRVLMSGHSGTLNVTPNFKMGGGVTKDGSQLTEGTVHEVKGIDFIASSVRMIDNDLRAQPDQITATMIASCEPDNWSKTIKTGDGLQVPIQPGQADAYHIRIIPDNPVVKEVLHGIGKPDAPDFIPPSEGFYFLSGNLVREAKEATPATVDKKGKAVKAFVAWDRVALQVTTAIPLEIQDMRSQKETNSTVAAHTPDIGYFTAATAGEGEASAASYGAAVDSLLD